VRGGGGTCQDRAKKTPAATAEISWQAKLMHIGLPLPRGLGRFLTLGRVDLGRLGRSISACCALDLDTAEGWILAGYFLAGSISSK